jgi:hypothetical protein
MPRDELDEHFSAWCQNAGTRKYSAEEMWREGFKSGIEAGYEARLVEERG